MTEHIAPPLSSELLKRIKLVRRDLGNLLFHFTRRPEQSFVEVQLSHGDKMSRPASAYAVLEKILYEKRLNGTSRWSYGQNCVCFTEAPMHEISSVFSLVEFAASESERPRYEPYGIAVNKRWLFAKGGRPAIYDHPDSFQSLSVDQRYRFVPYDPGTETDYTWEREWRIKAEYLNLDPKETLVVVPTAEEAFDLVYQFAKLEADYDDGGPVNAYHVATWLAVSLDIFGFGK